MASWPIWLRVAMGKHLVDGIRADASLAGNLATRVAFHQNPMSDLRPLPHRDTYGGNLPECMRFCGAIEERATDDSQRPQPIWTT